jgi:general secretion pathway protein D
MRNDKKNFVLKSCTFSALAFCLLGSPSSSYAQFSKYKSKTEYKPENQKDPASDSPLRDKLEELSQQESQTDKFGRSKIKKNIKVNNKYVNLNLETAFGPEIVENFDFENVSVVDLTKHMQKLTGINLIIEKELKGKISISASSAITVGDAWRAYLTALNINGYTLVKSGAFYKIVQSRDIRYTPTKIYTGDYVPDTENYIMKIIPLQNISSAEVTRSFRPFMSRYGRILDLKQTNTLIVQDTGDNINRLSRLIRFIDVPGHEESLQIIPVINSSAQEISKLLQQILRESTKSKDKKSSSDTDKNSIGNIIAEPRTNSIIAMATASGAEQLKALIKKLDIEGVNEGGGQIHVYYLNYGDSETISKTLSSLIGGSSSGGKKGSKFSKRNNNNDNNDSLFNSEVKITSDKENNALVVTASPTDWLTVRSVITKLDIPRDQVYVEGMIMETQVSKGNGFGVSLVGAYGTGDLEKAGFTGGTGGQDLINVLSNNITSLGGLFIGGGTGKQVDLNVGGSTVKVDNVSGLITAIANNAATNVLATPQILALDNTEASFEVGESVPVQEQTIANNQTQVTVKQQKAGLSLKITPQINKVTRFVKLKIDQKIEEFRVEATQSAAGGLATTNRAAITTVVVRDRDTIAMGGLMRDQTTESISKVPLLGDIPLLGWLFKNRSKKTSKVNLLFFLTPQIMDSYQKTIGSRIKTNLNQRAKHMGFTDLEDDPFGASASQLYQKASRQEKGSLVDTTQFKASQTIEKQNIEQEDLPSSVPVEPQGMENFQQSEEKVEVQTKEKDPLDNNSDYEEFEESDDDFSLEDEFESAKTNLREDNLSPPDYSKVTQDLSIRKSARKK